MLDCEMCVLQNAEYEKVFLFMDSPLLSWPLLSHVDYRYCYNNNNTLIYIAPACRMTSEALADSSSRATECLTEK